MHQIWPIGTEIWLRTDNGTCQNYIPPTLSGDNKIWLTLRNWPYLWLPKMKFLFTHSGRLLGWIRLFFLLEIKPQNESIKRSLFNHKKMWFRQILINCLHAEKIFMIFFVWFFSKLTFSKNSFKHTIRVLNSLDSDQAQHSVGPDLGQTLCIGHWLR